MFSHRWIPKSFRRPIDWDARFPEYLKGANRNYSRYAIVCTGRSGSSLLVFLLRSHPAIVSYSELFHPAEIQLQLNGFNNHDESLKKLRFSHTRDFLDNYVYRPLRDDVAAVGFKVFYSHMRHNRELQKYLVQQRDIKIIHLTRSNFLRSYVSGRLAAKTQSYGISSVEQRKQLTLTIDIEQCLRYLRKQAEMSRHYDDQFSRHPVFRVEYAELAKNSESLTKDLQQFLNVEPRMLSSTAVKQNPYPLQSLVTNFDELAEQLKTHKLAHFLVDE